MDIEVWKDVTGFEGYYQVSNRGQVRSIARNVEYGAWGHQSLEGKLLKPGINKLGYLRVVLFANHKQETVAVHRLVAKEFIPNPDGKRTVNHKNGIKTDNRVENLEWATYGENHKHAYISGIRNPPSEHPVLQLSKDGEVITEYKSIQEAERTTGIAGPNICACCKGKRYKTAGGFIWQYKNENRKP